MLDATIIERLRSELPEDAVHTNTELLDQRRFDQWPLQHLREFRGQGQGRPGAVVQPTTPQQVQFVVRVAGDTGTAVMPYGLGSGVCGGILPTEFTLLLDMSRMKRTRKIDSQNLLATFDAGKNGMEAEQEVAKHGLTIGHWPQSIAISTVGGWVSTRATGQLSTANGGIEDIVYSLEVVLPNGELVQLGNAPRAAAGPDLRHVVMGAEGTMGIVTGVTFSLRRQPEKQAYSAFYAPTMAQGFEAQRAIVQADWRPPVMRQYDFPEIARNFDGHVRGEEALILMVHEGPAGRVAAELEAVGAIAREMQLTEADLAVCDTWMSKRNHVPSWRELFELRIVADTIEVSARWSEIHGIYESAVASLKEVDGVINASAHSSHVYRSGLNLYFTFAALHEDPQKMEDAYLECWRRVMEATAGGGGGIAHHHGIGRLRKRYLARDLSPQGVELLRSIKRAVDPAAIMNPGNLIPDA